MNRTILLKPLLAGILLCLVLSSCSGQKNDAPEADPAPSETAFPAKSDPSKTIDTFQASNDERPEDLAAYFKPQSFPYPTEESERLFLTVNGQSYQGNFEKEREFTEKEQIGSVSKELQALRLNSHGRLDLSLLQPVASLTLESGDERIRVTFYTGLQQVTYTTTTSGCFESISYPGVLKISDLRTGRSQNYKISEEQMNSLCTILRTLYSKN